MKKSVKRLEEKKEFILLKMRELNFQIKLIEDAKSFFANELMMINFEIEKILGKEE